MRVEKRVLQVKEDQIKLKECLKVAASPSLVRKKLMEELKEIDIKLTEWEKDIEREKKKLREKTNGKKRLEAQDEKKIRKFFLLARDYPFCYTFTMAALTKACIAEQIQQNMGYSKKDASDFVNLIFRMIKNTLINGEMVKISGFGNFTVKQKEKRSGRNPQTGETMDITARRVITFKSFFGIKR